MTTTATTLDTWKGEPDRELQLVRPCSCGCDHRGRPDLVGYMIGSDSDGNGFTLCIFDEDVYQLIDRVWRLS